MAGASTTDLGAEFQVLPGASTEALGRHLWAIGVETDRWFEIPTQQRPHLLTLGIKRFDNAAFVLTEHMLDDGSRGPAVGLGFALGQGRQ